MTPADAGVIGPWGERRQGVGELAGNEGAGGSGAATGCQDAP